MALSWSTNVNKRNVEWIFSTSFYCSSHLQRNNSFPFLHRLLVEEAARKIHLHCTPFPSSHRHHKLTFSRTPFSCTAYVCHRTLPTPEKTLKITAARCWSHEKKTNISPFHFLSLSLSPCFSTHSSLPWTTRKILTMTTVSLGNSKNNINTGESVAVIEKRTSHFKRRQWAREKVRRQRIQVSFVDERGWAFYIVTVQTKQSNGSICSMPLLPEGTH